MDLNTTHRQAACPANENSCDLQETAEDITPEKIKAALQTKKFLFLDLNLDGLKSDRPAHKEYQSWYEKHQKELYAISVTSVHKIFNMLQNLVAVLNEPEFSDSQNITGRIRVGHKKFGTISYSKFHISDDQKFDTLYSGLCKSSEIPHRHKSGHHSQNFNLGFPRLFSFTPSYDAKNGKLRDPYVIPGSSIKRTVDTPAILINILNLRYKKGDRDALRDAILNHKYTHCILSPSVPKQRHSGWQKWDPIKWVGLLDHKVYSTNMPMPVIKEEYLLKMKQSAKTKNSQILCYEF